MFTNFLVNGVALLFNRTQPHALLLSQQRYDLSHSLSLFLLPKLPISHKKKQLWLGSLPHLQIHIITSYNYVKLEVPNSTTLSFPFPTLNKNHVSSTAHLNTLEPQLPEATAYICGHVDNHPNVNGSGGFVRARSGLRVGDIFDVSVLETVRDGRVR